MEEEKKPVAAPAAETEAPQEKTPRPSGNPGYEPHGARTAGRPGDRKFGNRTGRPSERRGGRGGFRRDDDDFKDRVVNINRISRTEKGGKHMRFDALVVIGDGKGHYGFGLAKSGEVPDAIKKSTTSARKKLYSVKIDKHGTIAHEVEGVYGATRVFLKPAPEGTGIIAGGPVRAVLELAGVKNVCSKVYGSRTPINVIRATHDGLQKLKNYETVMVLRGLRKPEDFKKEAPVKAPAKPVEGGK
ncbi:MAG: 30S ribosomal protein S5 [Bacilli bacterium]|nr:30S ribosomal protein S5 [Bacilli bacterium]